MALVQCHECSRSVSTEAAACPGCGAPMKAGRWVQPDPPSPAFSRPNTPPPEPPRESRWPLVGVLVVGAFVCFLLFGLVRGETPEELAQHQERKAIELCWQDQQKKSLAPDSARLIASMCEGLETTFRQKYNRNP